jgi:two-component system phosphate regulon sensor histidine kinase PhoR
MLFNARLVAFLVAFFVSLISTAFLYLVKETPKEALVVSYITTFTATYLLINFVLEYLVFKELKTINEQLEKIKKKEFKGIKKNFKTKLTPLEKLNDDISLFALKKEKELDELRKLEMYRKEFIADISHELKTPIFAAQGFIHTLLDGAMEDEAVREKFLKKAAKNLDGLNNLVQDLLMLSEMEVGTLKMHIKPTEIYSLALESVEQLEKKIEKKECEIKVTRSVEKPLLVEADRQRIRQVFINLIENAIKYGHEKGKIHVHFNVEKEHILVSIHDNGPGIPDADIKRIFERFYRVEKSRSKEKGGSGLGLAIVKQIIEAHKTQIEVTSKVGKGTTFSFKLKRAKMPVENTTEVLNEN